MSMPLIDRRTLLRVSAIGKSHPGISAFHYIRNSGNNVSSLVAIRTCVEAVQSIFGIHVDFLRAVKGGFFFHPSDEDLSPGTPERKKPLECVLSVYTNSDNALTRNRGNQNRGRGHFGGRRGFSFAGAVLRPDTGKGDRGEGCDDGCDELASGGKGRGGMGNDAHRGLQFRSSHAAVLTWPGACSCTSSSKMARYWIIAVRSSSVLASALPGRTAMSCPTR